MTDKTYIYEKKEYKKTGRMAKKTEERRGSLPPKIKELVEIHPSNVSEDNKEFDIWVSPEELFEVQG